MGVQSGGGGGQSRVGWGGRVEGGRVVSRRRAGLTRMTKMAGGEGEEGVVNDFIIYHCSSYSPMCVCVCCRE